MCRSRVRSSPTITVTDPAGIATLTGGAVERAALLLCAPAPYDRVMRSGGNGAGTADAMPRPGGWR